MVAYYIDLLNTVAYLNSLVHTMSYIIMYMHAYTYTHTCTHAQMKHTCTQKVNTKNCLNDKLSLQLCGYNICLYYDQGNREAIPK